VVCTLYGLLSVGFILLVVFLLYKCVRFAVRTFTKGFRHVRDTVDDRSKPPRDVFPSEAFQTYSINSKDFSSIVYKVSYRHPRVELVEIDGDSVFIEFSSQTGLTKNHTKIAFSLTGVDIGSYSIETDNYNSVLPSNIAERIRLGIREHVGLM